MIGRWAEDIWQGLKDGFKIIYKAWNRYMDAISVLALATYIVIGYLVIVYAE